MIIESLLEAIFALLQVIFSPIALPALPDVVADVLEQFKSIIVGGIGFLSVFVDFDVVKVLIPIVIVIANFDKIWPLIMFVLRKIPFLGIE